MTQVSCPPTPCSVHDPAHASRQGPSQLGTGGVLWGDLTIALSLPLSARPLVGSGRRYCHLQKQAPGDRGWTLHGRGCRHLHRCSPLHILGWERHQRQMRALALRPPDLPSTMQALFPPNSKQNVQTEIFGCITPVAYVVLICVSAHISQWCEELRTKDETSTDYTALGHIDYLI